MSKRRKNLLDAFRATGPAAHSLPPSATPLVSSQGNSPQSSAPQSASQQSARPANAPVPSAPRGTPMSGAKSSADAPTQARAPKSAAANSNNALPVTEELPFLPASTTARVPIAHTTAPSTPLSRDRVVLAALAIVVALLAVTLWVRSRQQSGVAAAQGVSSPASPDATAQNTAASSAAPRTAAPKAPTAVSTNTAPNNTVPTNPNPSAALAAGATDDDRAFYVLTNKFTVRLVQYDNDANAKKLAFEAYKYLRAEGVPAVQPIVSGDGAHIFLCAGAQPKKDDLAELTAWCVKLRGPSATSKKSPFSGAYVDNIDHVLKRN